MIDWDSVINPTMLSVPAYNYFYNLKIPTESWAMEGASTSADYILYPRGTIGRESQCFLRKYLLIAASAPHHLTSASIKNAQPSLSPICENTIRLKRSLNDLVSTPRQVEMLCLRIYYLV